MTNKELLKEIEALEEYRKLYKDSPTFDGDMAALDIVKNIIKGREVTEDAQEEKITLRELCNIFEMNASQIAKAVGYSRSGFVYSFNSKAKVSQARTDLIATSLRNISDEKHTAEIRHVEERRAERERAIRRFIKSYGGEE